MVHPLHPLADPSMPRDTPIECRRRVSQESQEISQSPYLGIGWVDLGKNLMQNNATTSLQGKIAEVGTETWAIISLKTEGLIRSHFDESRNYYGFTITKDPKKRCNILQMARLTYIPPDSPGGLDFSIRNIKFDGRNLHSSSQSIGVQGEYNFEGSVEIEKSTLLSAIAPFLEAEKDGDSSFVRQTNSNQSFNSKSWKQGKSRPQDVLFSDFGVALNSAVTSLNQSDLKGKAAEMEKMATKLNSLGKGGRG